MNPPPNTIMSGSSMAVTLHIAASTAKQMKLDWGIVTEGIRIGGFEHRSKATSINSANQLLFLN